MHGVQRIVEVRQHQTEGIQVNFIQAQDPAVWDAIEAEVLRELGVLHGEAVHLGGLLHVELGEGAVDLAILHLDLPALQELRRAGVTHYRVSRMVSARP